MDKYYKVITSKGVFQNTSLLKALVESGAEHETTYKWEMWEGETMTYEETVNK